MKLIRSLNNIRSEHRGAAITLGNFDGMHRGHQVIIQQLAAKARMLNCNSMAIILEPQPKEFFMGQLAPVRLMNLREKLLAFAKQPIDYVLCLPFNEKIRELTAEQVVKKLFVDLLQVKHIIIGDDFRFGRDRHGDFHLLMESGKQFDFGVSHTQTISWLGERVSSTWVREALTSANFLLAEQLLGSPYHCNGRIVHGDHLGRTLGVPTLNIPLRRLRSPLLGVFAVTVAGLASGELPAVANVGYRPTVDGHQLRLEVHVFDWQKECYGQHVQINFHHKLRDEIKFNGLAELQTQLQKDIQTAKDFFMMRPQTP